MTSTTTNSLKPNVGVYTNPAHDLWIEDATPKVDSLGTGSSLQPGEVTIGIKSSGICGLVIPSTQLASSR